MTTPCPYEVDVAAAAASGRWPEAASGDLQAHVRDCAQCQELASLIVEATVGSGRADRNSQLASAADVWWRLAIRARLEREHAAARPVVWLQGLAGACGVGLVLTAVGHGWPAAEGAAVTALAWFERLTPSLPRAVQPATDPLMTVVLAASGALAMATVLAAAFVWLVDD